MRLLITILLVCSLALAESTLSFSPQITGKHLYLWAVSGCPAKPLPIGAIYAIASQHGITWLTPATATAILAHKTVIGRVVKIGGYGAAAGGALVGMK